MTDIVRSTGQNAMKGTYEFRPKALGKKPPMALTTRPFSTQMRRWYEACKHYRKALLEAAEEIRGLQDRCSCCVDSEDKYLYERLTELVLTLRISAGEEK